LLVYSGHILIISNDLRRRMMSEIRKISKGDIVLRQK